VAITQLPPVSSHALSRRARSARVARSRPAKGFVEQCQLRLARPGAREQHAPRLAVRHFRQRALTQRQDPEAPQRALGVAPIAWR
jgi:hypothetical protein